MEISLILAHPNPGSFNHAIAQRALEVLRRMGHDVRYRDLYAEGFDPILPAAELEDDALPPEALGSYCTELRESDGIVIVHPNWWGQPPAILKGWVDRVFRPGVAYQFLEGDGGEGVPVGLLKARSAVVFNTSNTPAPREMEAFGDPLERLWKDCIFDLCGVKDFYRVMFGVIVTSTPEQRRAWLDEAERIIRRCFKTD